MSLSRNMTSWDGRCDVQNTCERLPGSMQLAKLGVQNISVIKRWHVVCEEQIAAHKESERVSISQAISAETVDYVFEAHARIQIIPGDN